MFALFSLLFVSFVGFSCFVFFKEEIPKETSFPFKVVLSTCAEFNLLYVHCDNRVNALKFTYLKSIIGLHCLFSLLFVFVFFRFILKISLFLF